MCGINGFTWEDERLVKAMNKEIGYRGPDDSGVYTNKYISLGHNRLSIVDLSKAGHQPMTNDDETIYIVYNGEIYNFKEIRQKLEKKGYRFYSGTDTEVIIKAYEEYGSKCLQLFNGMFSFALWDENKKELFLARDRMGIKPLYYYHDGRNLIFSSEIKSILKHNIPREVDTNCLNSFLTYRFIPSEKTMLSGVKKLQPGHFAVFKNSQLKITKYWDLTWKKTNYSEKYYLERLHTLLYNSVKKRLMSDVPLGAFLSGGLDSSLISAINTKLRDDPVKTFTVGFGHKTDEFSPAKKVADYLGTDHNELTLDYKNITRSLPRIIWQMDEPNSDITMVPQYFLSQFTKQKVTVVNTGEGADELFSGYEHFKVGADIFKPVPGLIKGSVYKWYYPPFGTSLRKNLLEGHIQQDKTMHKFLTSKRPPEYLNRILSFDIKHELPNWQLTRVDRMTMAHGMEARVPFLDHNVVNFATSLPVKYKQRGLEGKHLLKKLSLKYLPRDIVYRKKQGFTTPMHSWVKDNLEDTAEHLLFENKKPFFNYEQIKKLINKHKKSKRHLPFQRTSYQLLMLLFYDMWHEMYINNKSQKEIEKKLKI